MRQRADVRSTLAVLLFAWAGCTSRSLDVVGVRDAVFRQQVPFWLADHARDSGEVVCLGTSADGVVTGVDRAGLKRLTNEPAVRSLDDCEAKPAGAVEQSTSKSAILITVGNVRWVSRDEAVVEVFHFRSQIVSGRREYRVVRQQSGWVCLGQVVEMAPS